jgi:glycine dehydrogenase subunit 1
MRYLPHTAQDVRDMLKTIGVGSCEELFVEIPDKLRLKRPLELDAPLSEPELAREMERLSADDTDTLSFLGGGAYPHFIPAAIDQLVLRSEFTTAYTPYQPEISQGTLQAIFEFQTMVCQLTGMDVANASLYDGASACAEGALMAIRATRRDKVILSEGLHPEYRDTVITYCRYLDAELVSAPVAADGRTDMTALAKLLDDRTAAVIAGYPNFFGVVEDLSALADAAHGCGARLVASVQEPIALGLLKSPGELGADIVAGEGQSFGIPVSFGGPYLGFFAARQKDLRSMPGRLVGETVDLDGERGFVLTLATREQHIRREKATSNICSNQGLCALTATIYMALLGKQGLREVAQQNYAKANYAKEAIAALPGFGIAHDAPTFNEFVVTCPKDAEELLESIEEQDILAGIPLSRYYPEMADRLLVCVTETHSRADIDRLIAAIKGGAA